MGRYLDQLVAEFDEINTGNEEILNRAADESRDVSKDEKEQIERAQTRALELKKSIDYYSEMELTRSKVGEIRAKIPAKAAESTQIKVVERSYQDPAKALQGMFPSLGHYVVTARKAMLGDQAAVDMIARASDLNEELLPEEIKRATAHQTTADNPGLIPRPILGPLITLVNNDRPFINSTTRRPLPQQQFDRPRVSQHVQVDKQVKEKDLTASRQMKIDKLPVAADTFAGHLNISRQDIKWSQPSILQIVFEDFAHEYAMETESDAAAKFLAALAGNTAVPIAAWDGPAIRKLLFQAAGMPFGRGEPAGFPNTTYMSIDVWANLGGIMTAMGVPFFPGLEPGVLGGNLSGFEAVISPYFAAGTFALGKAMLNETYEDLDGLLQVAEPDVLGQLVGYSGEEGFLCTAPQVFTTFTVPVTAQDEELVAQAQADAAAAAKSSSK